MNVWEERFWNLVVDGEYVNRRRESRRKSWKGEECDFVEVFGGGGRVGKLR